MLCPLLLTILFTVISGLSTEKIFLELSKTISTDASFAGAIFSPPRKIRLPALAALRDFMLILPRTKQMASDMLLLPEPFGPRNTFIPGVNGISVFLGKLLKPCIISLFMYIEKIAKGYF